MSEQKLKELEGRLEKNHNPEYTYVSRAQGEARTLTDRFLIFREMLNGNMNVKSSYSR